MQVMLATSHDMPGGAAHGLQLVVYVLHLHSIACTDPTQLQKGSLSGRTFHKIENRARDDCMSYQQPYPRPFRSAFTHTPIPQQ
jgi:hypothetical protein